MAGTKRKPIRRGATQRPPEQSSLLPMPAHSARELSLVHHLALAACRGHHGDAHQINELVRSVYMAYYLQRTGLARCRPIVTNTLKRRSKTPSRSRRNVPSG